MQKLKRAIGVCVALTFLLTLMFVFNKQFGIAVCCVAVGLVVYVVLIIWLSILKDNEDEQQQRRSGQYDGGYN